MGLFLLKPTLFGFCSYFDYLQTLEKQVDSDWESVAASLEKIRNSFLSRKGALVNLTADSKLITKAESYVGSILQAFPNSLTSETGTWNTCLEPLNEGLIVPTQVSYDMRLPFAIRENFDTHREYGRGDLPFCILVPGELCWKSA